MKSAASKNSKIFFGAAVALVALCLSLSSSTASAQDDRSAPLTAPPPLKILSPTERTQLESARDMKTRVRLTMELAETRLAQAERLTTAQSYDKAATELGIYQGLIEDVMQYLSKTAPNAGKIRDLYKRIELTLREQAPRLETIRRTTPAEYAINVKAAADYARGARTDALNSFYGDTVMRESSGKDNLKPSPSANDHPKDNQPPPEKKP